MLGELTAWLVELVRSAFSALWSFVVDAAIGIVDLFIGAVTALASAIPVPDFLADGLAGVYAQLDPGIVYILGASGLPLALAIIGTGYAFRLGRKVATLFQW